MRKRIDYATGDYLFTKQCLRVIPKISFPFLAELVLNRGRALPAQSTTPPQAAGDQQPATFVIFRRKRLEIRPALRNKGQQ